jgi:homoserine kinase
MDPIDVVRLPVPNGLFIVLAHPSQRLRTADARGAAGRGRPGGARIRRRRSERSSRRSRRVTSPCSDARSTIAWRTGASTADPGFREAKAAAIAAGALGASISGAGPTTFALAGDLACAQAVAVAMEAAFAAQGITSSVRVCEVDRVGARAETDR